MRMKLHLWHKISTSLLCLQCLIFLLLLHNPTIPVPTATHNKTTAALANQPSASGLSSFINANVFLRPPSCKSISYESGIMKTKYFAGKIKFKIEWVHTMKDLFVTYTSLHPSIPLNFYINGIINSARYRGSQEYKILLDTSSLPISLEKCLLRSTVIKTYQNQTAHYTFDVTFPQGTKGIINV